MNISNTIKHIACPPDVFNIKQKIHLLLEKSAQLDSRRKFTQGLVFICLQSLICRGRASLLQMSNYRIYHRSFRATGYFRIIRRESINCG